MSTAEFAKLFTLPSSDSLVSRWERGVNLSNNKRLETIAEIGNITVDELLYGYNRVLRKKITNFTQEIKELGSEKYKLLYNPRFKEEVIDYMLRHFSFDGLSDIGIKNYTKQLLDNYLDRKNLSIGMSHIQTQMQ